MEKYGGRLKGRTEKEGIRDPFIKLLERGEIEGWERSIALRSVRVDPVNSEDFGSSPDLVLINPRPAIGIVECKRASSSEAKHGMFEQVLLYGEMVRSLAPDTFKERVHRKRSKAHGDPKVLDAFLQHDISDIIREPYLIVVVDRWGNRMNQTSRLTLLLLNQALGKLGRPPIEVWAVGAGRAERVHVAS